MVDVPVYKLEVADGLADRVRSSASLAHLRPVEAWTAVGNEAAARDQAIARLRSMVPERARAGLDDFDLHYVRTILVTAGWNKNDDVFDPLELWVARKTPAHKPFNYEHDCAHVIGHTVENWAMALDGSALADDLTADDVPASYHLADGGVLYKCWDKPDLQERMDRILAEIPEGKWFVSMECHFKGFDYALKAADGSSKLVARNEKTAFLTKHLRAYGGTGRYAEYRVGRVLRNVVFAGKGLVRNPANPDSVILPDPEPFLARASLLTDFPPLSPDRVYVPADKAAASHEGTPRMPTDAEKTLQDQLAAAKAENEQLKASKLDLDVKAFKDRAEAAEAARAKADELLKAANEALAAAKAKAEADAAELAARAAKLADAEKALAEHKEEISALHGEKRTQARVAAVKEKLKFDAADAAEFVEANAALTDEQFGKQVDLVAKTISKFTPAPLPPKGTPAPDAPKSTPAPAPAKAAALPDLDAAEPAAEPALSTAAADSGVDELQKQIAAFLGCDVDAAE